ncbi:uncharacterized protein si:dkey-24l11.2 [Trichomycterus rosablanca]|uniref:uncharacterized protein si:dkey-24l11.2 n=1 Tax=Trichomycterus rosablanca TaxID=2290929 RepID=UPI002F34F63C
MEPRAAEQPSAVNTTEQCVLQSEKENKIHTKKSACKTSQQPTQPLCRFYSQGRCYYGKRCRFLHQRATLLETVENRPKKETKGDDKFLKAQQQSDTCRGSGAEETPEPRVTTLKPPPAKQVQTHRTCRYFLSGFCTMEERCRFWHPQQLPPVEDQSAGRRERTIATAQQQLRLADLTDEMSKKLRETEITQLLKRFPKDKIIVQEREDGQLAYYRVTVEATDPDWPYDLKETIIMVSFPENYPQEVFTIDVPEDQDLPSVMGRHIEMASREWLQAKHATNQLMGRLELLFRPLLRWLDHNMERLFTEGARKLKKEIELEKSGIQFVPYEHLKAAVYKNPDAELSAESKESQAMVLSEEEEKNEATEEKNGDQAAVSSLAAEEEIRVVTNIVSSEPRRGTEVRLLDLRLGEATATVVASQITVSLQCNRCKVTSDLTLSQQLPCTAQCEKCGSRVSGIFRPSMIHHYCSVLGYLDLNMAAPVDLVLQECKLTVGCMNCNNEDTIEGLSYGQHKETNCQHCHSKISIFVEASQFQYVQPKTRTNTGERDSAQHGCRYIRDPAVQQGKPLPEKGACKHYKQSHRWLRFPCCGRAYPCDLCHDEDQDHLMELATRMICGFCAKEQPYSNGKPCFGCGGMMTKGSHTSHWEGGFGCRNKIIMNRNDRQKYSNTCKTVSRKAKSEK